MTGPPAERGTDGSRLPRIVLRLGAAAFGVAGLAFLVRPSLVRLVDLPVDTATAHSDVRAVFGGLELGIGALLAFCAGRPAWHRAGLLAQALAFGGLAVGRLVSLALDGTPRAITFALWGPELLGAALSAVALRRPGAPATDFTGPGQPGRTTR